MRRLLLSDIHANMEALNACLARADEVGFDSLFAVGTSSVTAPNRTKPSKNSATLMHSPSAETTTGSPLVWTNPPASIRTQRPPHFGLVKH